MKPVISIGNQDFVTIRENNCFYVDKTRFIKEWWESGDIVTLVTRPRRFGKTLNISMLEAFFSVQYAGKKEIFEGLSVWQEEKYHNLQGTYPVISLSFAAVKEQDYKSTIYRICQIIQRLFIKNQYLMDSDVFSVIEKERYMKIAAKTEPEDAPEALNLLSEYLMKYYNKKVLVFLDEYDTPMQEAYVNGYWKEIASFISSMFNMTFKTNPYLERGIMAGITRISKESIFSGLNNLEVVTVTSEKYRDSFGFTQEETEEALKLFGLSGTMEKVKHWYDGFKFGSQAGIYNPWSITKYLDSGKFGTYWANTSSNSLAGKLIQESTPEIKIAVEDLLARKDIVTHIDEEIVFNQLGESDTAIWSLLLASGYLKAGQIPEDKEDGDDGFYKVSLVNFEVMKMFRKMIQGWFHKPGTKYNDFIKALLVNNVKYMNQYMNQVTERVFSFFDTGKQASNLEPERFYHGFVLGLVADSEIDYIVTSNRESGFGRYDVMMEPKSQAGNAYIFEFKVHDPDDGETLYDTVKAALAQIKEKNYDAALIAKGFPKDRIFHYGFAFEGKKVLIGN